MPSTRPFTTRGPLVAIMAAATQRIGLAATLSSHLLSAVPAGTPHDHPADHLRWITLPGVFCGVATSAEEALNFGYQELLDHDQRYDRADEYLELCAQLWASWEPDAVVMDARTEVPSPIRQISTDDRLSPGHLLSVARAAQRHAVAAEAPRHYPGPHIGARAGISRRAPRRSHHCRSRDGRRH